ARRSASLASAWARSLSPHRPASAAVQPSAPTPHMGWPVSLARRRASPARPPRPRARRRQTERADPPHGLARVPGKASGLAGGNLGAVPIPELEVVERRHDDDLGGVGGG